VASEQIKNQAAGIPGVQMSQKLGHEILRGIRYLGGINLLFFKCCKLCLTTPPRWKHIFSQMHMIGIMSAPLVFLTALFTGVVLAMQSAYQLKLFSAVQYTADLVSLSICRELGPVLTAMVVAGRVGASIAAEIGTMRVTEQVDALESMGTDPIRYLVVPRFVAAAFMMLILTIYGDVVGTFGGYIVGVLKLDITHHQFLQGVLRAVGTKDILTGLVKAVWFGVIISVVGCYFGLHAKGGAQGVGMATTLSVMTSLISIIAFDALFTAIFYFMF
jgi:phospholipid/cholesterol/gamma-HCH transport system permease protein